jgi:SnoaL-like domain
MTCQEVQARIAQHTAAFNAAVQSGDWRSFAERFTPDATMRFIRVPAGPCVGRAAIARVRGATAHRHANDPPGGLDRAQRTQPVARPSALLLGRPFASLTA